ncbi:MAG: type II toxin-antitoxin system VapC family toxin [Spirochaetaceae bacterium]|nr:MAG: type II toxin-antitoxin system VapC family toxin [Spirochaetaceae bacterium]
MMRIVLDTHILIYWCTEPERLTAAQQHAMRTIEGGNPAIVADISLWEVSALAAAGRISMDIPLLQWLNRAVAPPLVRTAEITPAIADEVSRLQDWENRDPADRLIVATTRVFGARLLTNDSLIRESGLVPVI